MVTKVPGTGQPIRTAPSSSGAFGFWRLSAREGTRRLGRFRGGGRFMSAKSTQRVASERPMARGFPRCRPQRRDTPDFDGTAGTPSVCRAVLAAVLGRHALQTCVRLCGCAGGSYPSHPASPVHQPHGSEGSRRERAATTRPQAGIGRVLAWACCARRTESPNSAYSGWSARARRCARAILASGGLCRPIRAGW